jgi:hypothetical protein
MTTAARTPLQDALYERLVQAARRVSDSVDRATAKRALAEEDAFGTLLTAVTAAGPHLARAPEPLAAARLRAARTKRDLLEREGGALGVGQVAALLGVSRQAVDQARRRDRLLGLPVGRSFLYPAWQVVDGQILSGLPEVLRRMSLAGAWARLGFFLQPDPSLDGSRPLDALRAGDVAAVGRAAEAYGTHGAQ